MNLRPTWIACAGAALLLALAGRAMACPDNCYTMGDTPGFCSPATVLDTTLAHDPAFDCSDDREANWNMPNGTLACYARSPFGQCTPRTTVQDDFTLLGPPAGTPVGIMARLNVSVVGSSFDGDGTVDARMVEGVANMGSKVWDIQTDLNNPFPPVTHQATITVPVSAIAGTPFHMTYWLGSSLGGGCSAYITATFTFDGLPPGASVVSCKGFVEAPTAAHAASWGSVKARYR